MNIEINVKEMYEIVSLFGGKKTALFTEKELDEDVLPHELHSYDLCEDELCFGKYKLTEPGKGDGRFVGTLITTEELDLPRNAYDGRPAMEVPEEDLFPEDMKMSIKEFIREMIGK